MKKRFSTMQRSGVLKRIFTCVIALALAMPMTVQTGWAATTSYTVTVADGYLALRNAKAYDDKNEIGKLYTGDTVDVTDSSGSTYWYVYASRLKKSGYVNRRYLANSSSERYVSVKSGYLALRNAKAFKSSNEVAELYTGDKVQIADSSDSTYWLVYVPGLGKGGYVNKDYLVKNKDNTASAVVTKTVKVKSGYLALRNAKAYDDANEIGQLNTGDTVQVQDSSGSTYWYVYSSRLGKSGYVNKNYLQRCRKFLRNTGSVLLMLYYFFLCFVSVSVEARSSSIICSISIFFT